MEEDEEYWEKWKSHSRCLKNLKPSCEECLDVERCKRDYKFNMLEYQLMRKREGQISVEFDAWFEQELKTIDLDSIPYDNVKLYHYKLEIRARTQNIFDSYKEL